MLPSKFWSFVCRFCCRSWCSLWATECGNFLPKTKQNQSKVKKLVVLLLCCWIEVAGAAERDDGAGDWNQRWEAEGEGETQQGSMASLFDARSPDPLAFFPRDYFPETPGYPTSKAEADEADEMKEQHGLKWMCGAHTWRRLCMCVSGGDDPRAARRPARSFYCCWHGEAREILCCINIHLGVCTGPNILWQNHHQIIVLRTFENKVRAVFVWLSPTRLRWLLERRKNCSERLWRGCCCCSCCCCCSD